MTGWFESAWAAREEESYRRYLGGGSDEKIVPIPYEAFSGLGVTQVDPRWLDCGVLLYRPVETRAVYTRMTSGLSNAWEDAFPNPEGVSGLGIELRIDTVRDEFWALDVLLRLAALQLLIGAGCLPNARLLASGGRVRVASATFGQDSAMVGLLAVSVATLTIPTGRFGVLQLYPVTEAELQFASTEGSDVLLARLREHAAFPVADIHRRSAV